MKLAFEKPTTLEQIKRSSFTGTWKAASSRQKSLSLKRSSHNSRERLFIHLLQCSARLFLSFFRSLGCLMIPACLYSVYITSSGAQRGLPLCLQGHRAVLTTSSCGIKPVFQSNLKPYGGTVLVLQMKPQRLDHHHRLQMGLAMRCFIRPCPFVWESPYVFSHDVTYMKYISIYHRSVVPCEAQM